MSAEINIREADLDCPVDCAMLVGLLDDYATDPMGLGCRLPEDVRVQIAPGLRAHPASFQALAFAGNALAGAATCFLGYSTFSGRELVNIHDLIVRSELRRQGIGARLLDHIERTARQRGCGKLTLEVRHDNLPAKSLYRSHGFAPGCPAYEFWTKALG